MSLCHDDHSQKDATTQSANDTQPAAAAVTLSSTAANNTLTRDVENDTSGYWTASNPRTRNATNQNQISFFFARSPDLSGIFTTTYPQMNQANSAHITHAHHSPHLKTPRAHTSRPKTRNIPNRARIQHNDLNHAPPFPAFTDLRRVADSFTLGKLQCPAQRFAELTRRRYPDQLRINAARELVA